MQTRLERAQARHDTRDWVQERRARTRQLIELGGLVQKAGLVELTGDDRATLLGAMMYLADQLRGGRDGVEDRTSQQLAAAWRHRGLRAFEQDRKADAPAVDVKAGTREEGQPVVP
jgi:hypothetical protein